MYVGVDWIRLAHDTSSVSGFVNTSSIKRGKIID
jgi:hypothetical protein